MEKKPTLKDIAKASGYSLASVHRALNKKDGVSEEVQNEILGIAREMGYTANYLASTLKRKQINIAVAFPEPASYGRHYFSYMWNGCREMCTEIEGYNINIEEYLYQCALDGIGDEKEVLERLLAERGDYLDGILVAPSKNINSIRETIGKYIAKGVQVVLIDNDFPDSGRLCCIAPHDIYTGRMAAECMTGFLHKPGTILMASGDRESLSHCLNKEGFCSYITENQLPFQVVNLDEQLPEEIYRHALQEIRERGDVVGLYSVRARFTQALGRAAMDSGQQSKLCVIGSDLFEESAQMLRDGILKGIVYKNPYQKGYLGMKVLFESLIKGQEPKDSTLLVPISIIFKSNLRFFEEFI